MAGRTILKVENPTTQSIDSVKALLAYVGRGSDPLPSDVSLDNGRLVLVLSNKKDSYYTVTATKCSCPAAVYHHGPCKHQRKYFPVAKVEQPRTTEPLIKRGGFRPVDTLPGEEKAASSSFCVIDTTPDATPRELAYWSIKQDRDMWPAEA
jgi:hypothetical protein